MTRLRPFSASRACRDFGRGGLSAGGGDTYVKGIACGIVVKVLYIRNDEFGISGRHFKQEKPCTAFSCLKRIFRGQQCLQGCLRNVHVLIGGDGIVIDLFVARGIRIEHDEIPVEHGKSLGQGIFDGDLRHQQVIARSGDIALILAAGISAAYGIIKKIGAHDITHAARSHAVFGQDYGSARGAGRQQGDNKSSQKKVKNSFSHR